MIGRKISLKEAYEHAGRISEEAEERRRLERAKEFMEMIMLDIDWNTDEPPKNGKDILALYEERSSGSKEGEGYLKAYIVSYNKYSKTFVTDQNQKMGNPKYWILITYPEKG